MPVIKRSSRAFSERNPASVGIVGTAVLGALLLMAVNLGSLPILGAGREYKAYFSEAGSLAPGDDVLVAGFPVGRVSSVALDGSRVVVGFKITDKGVRLGDQTRATIITETVLGKAAVRLNSGGSKPLDVHSPISLARTAAQYDVTAALSGLTKTTDAIDVGALTHAIDAVNETFSGSPDELHAALTGIAGLSETIASRDADIRKLLASAKSVTGLLKDRNQRIDLLLSDGASLLKVIDQRKQAITELLQNTTALATSLRDVVATQRKRLGPALGELNVLLRLLNRNQENLEKAIDGLNGYASTLGNAISSGPFFDGYVANLTSPTALVPVLSDIMAGGSK